MAKITYTNKEALNINAEIADINKVNASDMNEIKSVVNSNDVVGSIVIYAGSTAPNGYLMCDGSAISRTTYSELFNIIGTTYGIGDGSTTFNVPNLKGKVVVGLDSTQTEFDTLGETGGEKTHTLTVDEIPSHNHSYTRANADGWKYQTGDLSNVRNSQSTVNTGNTGGGLAHNNLQPYISLNYIIHY